MLKHRVVMGTIVLSAALFTSQAVYAAPAAAHASFTSVSSREKFVKFNVRNATSAPIKVKAGSTEMTLAPGQTAPMKLVEGTEVVSVDETGHYKAGEVIIKVGSQNSDSTVVLN